MSKVWYDHLVVREEINAEILAHKLPPEEAKELLELVDQILHHHALNVVLSHLPKEHHEEFINRFHASPHDPTLLAFVQDKVTINISAEIKKQADRVKKDLLADIKKSTRPRRK